MSPRAIPASVTDQIIAPSRLWSRSEVLTRPCPVPASAGVYGWFFREIPPGVPTTGCVTQGDLTLLYVGISPTMPPRNGKPPSRQRLRTRICYHFRGNAEGSTLRLTLGCLLQEELGIELRRVGSGKRRTFASGESLISEWMERNAFVCWAECAEPWVVEEQLISEVSLPLNLDQNAHHSFCSVLKAIRAAAAAKARILPVVR